MKEEWIVEAVKLIAQLLGAILVARLAVRWALSRYKTEKTWERRLSAYVEVVTALSEMKLIVGLWIDAIERAHLLRSDEPAQRERYQSAKRRLDEATATAQLLLPPTTYKRLLTLDVEMEKAQRFKDQYEDLNNQYAVIEETLSSVLAEGRADL